MAQYDKTIQDRYKEKKRVQRREKVESLKSTVKTAAEKVVYNVKFDINETKKTVKDFSDKTAKNTALQIEMNKAYRRFRKLFDKTKIGQVETKVVDGVRYTTAYTEYGPIIQTLRPSSTIKKASIDNYDKTFHTVPAVDSEVSVDVVYEGQFPDKETGKLHYANLNAKYFSGPGRYYPTGTPYVYEGSTLVGAMKKGAFFEDVNLLSDEFRFPLFHDKDSAVYAFRCLEDKFRDVVKSAGMTDIEIPLIEQRELSEEELKQMRIEDEIYYFGDYYGNY